MTSVDRRSILIGGAALALPFGASAQFESKTPQDLGFASDIGDKLDAGLRSGLLRGFHSILVMRSGKLVLERYFSGPDEAWGRALGNVEFGPATLHDLRSVTKSVVSLLYGVALDLKLVPSPEESLLAQFPEYSDLASDQQRAGLKVVHALTMTMGLQWNEQVSYGDPANSETMMERAQDRYRFVLDRPIVSSPGKRWIYSGGCAALIGAIISKGARKPLADFARDTLFADLGISEFEWAKGGDGVYSAASGLRLKPRDLVRIGELAAAGGKMRDRQLVSQAWIDASFKPAISTGDGLQYGYMWYLGRDATPAIRGPQTWIGAFGNGGQRLWIMPSAELTVASTAGAYNTSDQFVVPTRVWREIVLPNLLKL